MAEHDEALPIDQDAAVLGATLATGQVVEHRLGRGRQAYLVRCDRPGPGQRRRGRRAGRSRDHAATRPCGSRRWSRAEILLADLP